MSKRVWNHPEVPVEEKQVQVWRSQDELDRSPLFRNWLDREFPEKSSELTEEERELSRRNFVKLMGASSALAGLGLASCRRPEVGIMPFIKAPEWVIPGKALYYASSMPKAGGSVPLMVTSYEGRPTKLEPNEECPDADGTSAFTQASILNLYDPVRSKSVLNKGKKSDLAAFQSALGSLIKENGRIGFVFGKDDSPTRNRLWGKISSQFPKAKAYAYEALESDTSAEALGKGVKLNVDFARADRVLSFDCDFLELDQVGQVGPFYDRRQGGGNTEKGLYAEALDPDKMNRLYQVEAAYSLTGGLADHRIRVAPSQMVKFASAVAARLGVAGATAPEGLTEGEQKWVAACAADLNEHAGKSIVLAGSRHSKTLQSLVAAMNMALGNVGEGKPGQLLQTGLDAYETAAQLAADLEGEKLDAVVLMTPANPVYDFPADVDFGALLEKVPTSIHLGLRTDATAYAATWHVPSAHYLESWGDTKSSTGTHLLLQPLILPLYGGVGELELLSAFLNKGELALGDEKTPAAGYNEVRETFEAASGNDVATWNNALKMGFVEAKYSAAALPQVQVESTEEFSAPVPTKEALDVMFAPDASVWDGRYIDNSWLQEAPDPMSKLTWDNAAYISPKTADALRISKKLVELEPKTKPYWIFPETATAPQPEIGEAGKAKAYKIDVTINGETVKMAVMVAFGLAENTIVLPVGYGQAAKDGRSGAIAYNSKRPTVGDVGLNSGFNVYPLRTQEAPFFASGAVVEKNSGRYSVALTQEHHSMYGRAIAREVSTNDVKSHGHKVGYKSQVKKVAKQGMDSHMPPNQALYKSLDTKGQPLISDKIHQWAMAIDLNVCTGCNSCLVACQAENNIPVVGKEQVAKGREMHWIRMDRYFAAVDDEDNPEMIPQPVACVQCEKAPCETVCPVNATVHNEEGLNVMAYNRCIGTRYCANNCPYKARRFNFFDYNKRNPLIEKNLYKGPLGKKQEGDARSLQRNPNVSVRMRGVMEKCTYCVQRLENAKIKQKQITRSKALVAGLDSDKSEISNEDLRIAVDSVKVACQSACSAGAITFGNKLDGKKAAVVRAKDSLRNYDLLNYIGTLPRTSYLARVKNPNPDVPGAEKVGTATVNIH